MNALSVYIGFDPRQPVAFNTLAQSIWRYASKPIPITPLKLDTLPISRRGLTDFTYSRFLVPWLSQYEGYSLFVDSDVVCLHDVVDLLMYPIANPDCDVYVVQHQKLRFEWASIMLFNNEKCRTLTPAYVEDTSNKLFDFKWASRVGGLPSEWNHLSMYDEPRSDAKMVHFTQGLPCWPETRDSEYKDQWYEAFDYARQTCSWQELMANSVHAKPVMERLAANGS